MNKKVIIYISCGIVIALILGISIYFILRNNFSNVLDNVYNTKKVVVEKYEDDGTTKAIEITKTNEIKKLTEICNNISLEQDDTSAHLAIKNDVKIDLNNGIIFFIQLDLDDYCYMENENSNINAVIKMPEGLLGYINEILK